LAEVHFSPARFSEVLLDWYACRGRALPWRNTRNPYYIWLAEIMLQQTTVAAVVDYFKRFITRWPTLEALASASIEEVVEQWAGLGYYSRARNLHRTAQAVVQDYAGEFPQTVVALQTLPGIGRSTAGAIAALAFEERAPILDGNVRRVLCRLMALQQPPRSAASEKQLWIWAEELTPMVNVHDYTQAIMDLGATICTPRSPLCHECPSVELCQAYALDLVDQLPLKQKSKKIPLRHEIALLIDNRGQILVRRRALEGFLGGLWEFPCCSLGENESAQQKLAWLVAEFGLNDETQSAPSAIAEIEHVYSHFRLQVSAYRMKVSHSVIAEGDNRWLKYEDLTALALHGAHKKILPHIHES
jgi:A/G-specific adenine glycosylase